MPTGVEATSLRRHESLLPESKLTKRNVMFDIWSEGAERLY
jgi:hypothetical protein